MQEAFYHFLKRGNHLALSHRQHLNGFPTMLTYPRPIDFLYPMSNGILVRGILCAKELIREGIKRDRRTIRPYEDHRITLAKGIGPTRSPVILDRALSKDGRDVLGKRCSIERLIRH